MRIFLLCFLLIACDKEVSVNDADRQTTIDTLAESVIKPTLHEMLSASSGLNTSLKNLGSAPTDANLLNTAQQAWKLARAPLKQSETFAFGPTHDALFLALNDQFPIAVSKIEDVVAGSGEIVAADLPGDAKGFHAVEYLLFDHPEKLADARRTALLLALGELLHAQITALHTAWMSHVTELTHPHSIYTSLKSSIDAVVNQSIFLSEDIVRTKIGKPFGNANGGTPQPELQESLFSDHSLEDMYENLIGIRNMYFGTRDGGALSGIHFLVNKQRPEVDTLVRDALSDALTAVENIRRPFGTALVEKDSSVEQALTAVKTLNRVLSTEVVTVLGVTVKFNDNDGD